LLTLRHYAITLLPHDYAIFIDDYDYAMPYYAIIIFAIIDYAITLHFIIFDIIAITPLPPLADLRHADAIRCHY
jgi:hypothetical protein